MNNFQNHVGQSGISNVSPPAAWIRSWVKRASLLGFVLAFGMGLIGSPVFAVDNWDNDNRGRRRSFCTQTAIAVAKACQAAIRDDFWIAIGKCINVSDRADRRDCEAEAIGEREEAMGLCQEQHAARRKVCSLLGEERYDPAFNPAKFVDPDTIHTGNANPYFPLIVGNQWTFEGGGERIVVTVTNKTKLIAGVTCRVVRDVVTDEDGNVIEDTNDWYAQDLAYNVWYCGEEVKDFETFEGDNPSEPELVAIDGSFKVGRDGAKPGIIMLGNPQVGDTYRQEVFLGEAEDFARVISVTGTDAEFAAQCNNKCLITREGTPIEPGVEADKYYAPGLGPILEVEGDTRVKLIDFTAAP